MTRTAIPPPRGRPPCGQAGLIPLTDVLIANFTIAAIEINTNRTRSSSAGLLLQVRVHFKVTGAKVPGVKVPGAKVPGAKASVSLASSGRLKRRLKRRLRHA
jgi:hypothetical protein